MSSARSFIKAVLITAIIAGILDITLGVLGYYVLVNGYLPENIPVYFKNVLRYIASGAFSNINDYNSTTLEITGLLFHFFIAISFTWFYFLIYPSVRLLQRSIIISSILYGIFVWAVMNMLVLPLVFHTPHIPADMTNAVYQALILIICIALPISIGAKNHYSSTTAFR